jgi:hypothetical protein
MLLLHVCDAGVSSEGEKPQAVEELEEGREAEATVQPAMSSTSTRRMHGGTARRSGRSAFRSRGRVPMRPTPIVWNEPGSTSHRGKCIEILMGLLSPVLYIACKLNVKIST